MPTRISKGCSKPLARHSCCNSTICRWHGDSHPHAGPRILFGASGFRIAEEHQHRVADEFVDVRAMSERDLRHCGEVSVQHRRQVFRLHVGGGCGEILDVAEEHRQPLAFGGELHVARTREDRRIDLGREVFGELDREALQHPGLFVQGRVPLLDLLQRIAQQQVGRQARAHDGGVERLVNVIDRAKLKPFCLILGFGAGGQKDHRKEAVSGSAFSCPQTS
jgi:hypothetical protein